MRLPVSVMIAIAIVVIALVVIVAWFVMMGGGAAVRAELQATFTQNCLTICGRADRATINLAALYPEWQSACEQLFDVPRGASAQCLERCECGRLAEPCEFLCGFEYVVADWPAFCNRIRTHAATSPTYGACDCIC